MARGSRRGSRIAGSERGDDQRSELASALDSCACFQLRRASRAVTQMYDAALQPSGLRSTQFVILGVIRVEEPVRQDVLAELLGMDRSTLSRNLQPLTAAGLLRRIREPGERASRLRLTPKGVRKVEQAIPLWADVQASFETSMGPSRWNVLRRRLKDASAAARDE